MNRGKIKKIVRDRLAEDNTRQIAESFWLDSDLDEYIEEVIEEIAQETDCIQDQFLINVDTTNLSYALDPIILTIKRAKRAGYPVYAQTTTDSLDLNTPNWETEQGTNKEYVLDYIKGYLTLDKLSDTAYDLTITASRLPLADMDSDTDIPEIPLSYHRRMINGILYKASTKVGAPPSVMEKTNQYLQLYLKDIESIKQDEIKAIPLPIKFLMVDAGPTRNNVRSSYGF